MKNKEIGNKSKLNEILTKEEINKSKNINKITDKIYLGVDEGTKEWYFFKTEQIHYILSIVKKIPIYLRILILWMLI